MNPLGYVKSRIIIVPGLTRISDRTFLKIRIYHLFQTMKAILR